MTASRQTPRNRRSAAQRATKAQPRSYSGAVSEPSTSTSDTTTTPVAAGPSVAASGAYSWTHDYDYVKKDLRKLGIVSAVLFLAIIVAGFFV